MEHVLALEKIGLSNGESKVYTALLKLNAAPVSAIKQETQIHRTTIYDFLESLIKKGMVSYVIKNNVKYYRAADPSKLLDYIKEKEAYLKTLLPSLIKLQDQKREEITVETFRGQEGFKTVLNDIIKVKKDVVGFGVDEIQFKTVSPFVVEHYFNKLAEASIKEKLLTSESAKFIFDKKTTTYRFIPKEFFGPTPTLIYGQKVAIIIWEPLTIIIIKNSALAETYRTYFEVLWQQAKKSNNVARNK